MITSFFTNIGKVHWLKVYEILQAGRAAKGRAVVNLLQLRQPGEKISTVVPIRRFWRPFDQYGDENGIAQKTELTAYGNLLPGGIIALTLDDSDVPLAWGSRTGTRTSSSVHVRDTLYDSTRQTRVPSDGQPVE